MRIFLLLEDSRQHDARECSLKRTEVAQPDESEMEVAGRRT